MSNANPAVPFVFTEQPSATTLQAAGILASWLGALAKTHMLTVPVTVGGPVPKGNVVLFVENPSDLPQGMDLDVSGPTIAVRTNPSDPYGKVLVIAGADPTQLVTAARAIALQNAMLQGRTAQYADFELPAPREADDAPLWMSTDRISPFWGLIDHGQICAATAPDAGCLFTNSPGPCISGDRTTVPLRCRLPVQRDPAFRTDRPCGSPRTIHWLTSCRFPRKIIPRKYCDDTAAVPLIGMRPFANTFLFNFYFQIAKTGHCQDVPPINLQGGILRSSYLDLRGIEHWAAMPNLELFANAGFPFTRFADLSQTTVVMPPTATEKEIGVYLMLMSYFSAQTGYPALRVSVGSSAALGKDVDYLIIGTAGDQPAFEHLNGQLPVSVASNAVTIRDTGGMFSAIQHAWWQVAEMRLTGGGS